MAASFLARGCERLVSGGPRGVREPWVAIGSELRPSASSARAERRITTRPQYNGGSEPSQDLDVLRAGERTGAGAPALEARPRCLASRRADRGWGPGARGET